MFQNHVLYDRLSNKVNNSAKDAIKTIIDKKIYMNPINFKDFKHKMDQHQSKELLRSSIKKDVTKIDKLFLAMVVTFDPDETKKRSIEHLVSAKTIKNYNDKHETHLPVNHIGNMSLFLNMTRKPASKQTVEHLIENEVSRDDIYKDNVFIDDKKYTLMLENGNVLKSIYYQFLKERYEKMFDIYYEKYIKTFTVNVVDDEIIDDNDTDSTVYIKEIDDDDYISGVSDSSDNEDTTEETEKPEEPQIGVRHVKRVKQPKKESEKIPQTVKTVKHVKRVKQVKKNDNSDDDSSDNDSSNDDNSDNDSSDNNSDDDGIDDSEKVFNKTTKLGSSTKKIVEKIDPPQRHVKRVKKESEEIIVKKTPKKIKTVNHIGKS